MSNFYVDRSTPLKRKVVVVGDPACGKTCLLNVFVDGSFPETVLSTVTDSYNKEITVDGKQVSLELHDTAGGVDYERLRSSIYPGTDAVLICFAVSHPVSLSNVENQWEPEVRHYCRNVPIILVGNKKDLRNDPAVGAEQEGKKQQPVSEKECQQMAKRIGAAAYVECSAKTSEGVQEVFEKATKETIITDRQTQKRKSVSCRQS